MRDRNDFLVLWTLELMMATADPDFNPSGLGQHLHQFRAVHGCVSYTPIHTAVNWDFRVPPAVAVTEF